MSSIFIFISGATLLVYSAERLISALVGVSRGLRISVFLLAIIFTGIEFDDIVLGVALNLEDEQEVALGLVLGTAVSFTGIVLALGAILTPTRFDIPREYIVIFAARSARHGRVRPEEGGHRPRTPSCCSSCSSRGSRTSPTGRRGGRRRRSATSRSSRRLEEDDEDDADPARAEAVSTMSPFSAEGRFSGWLNLGIAVLALGGIIIGAATVSEGTEEIIDRYGIEGTVFGATIVTAVLCIEDLFLTVQPIRKGVPEIGIGNVIGSLVFSVTGKLGIVVLAGGPSRSAPTPCAGTCPCSWA